MQNPHKGVPAVALAAHPPGLQQAGPIALAIRIGQNYLRIPKERRPLLARDWKRLGKDWKGLPLVEIHTVQGDDIRITL